MKNLNKLVLFLLVSVSSQVFAEDKTVIVHFKRGTTSAHYHDGLIRGDSTTYRIDARKGQILTVKINSLEDNAVFNVQLPKSTQTLGGAAGTEVTSLQQALPVSGNYDIVIGNERGNSSYNLDIEIQ